MAAAPALAASKGKPAVTENRRRVELGFTLVEVLVVMVVIGILSAIAIVSLASAMDRAKQRATMADMRIIARAVQAYIVDNHRAPSDAGGMAALREALIPYQTNVLPVEDHWHNGLAYASDGLDYTIQSHGRDGVDGADITTASRFDFDLDIVIVNGSFTAAPE
jgi:general secretion pathway protein G